MVFSSIIFLFYFLPIFLIVYYLLNKKLKNYWILVSSLVFYAWGAPTFIFIVLIASSLDFFVVNRIHQAEGKTRKRWLVLSIFLNLGLLGYFKYANFFIANVNLFLSNLGFESIEWTYIVLPVGISFYPLCI